MTQELQECLQSKENENSGSVPQPKKQTVDSVLEAVQNINPIDVEPEEDAGLFEPEKINVSSKQEAPPPNDSKPEADEDDDDDDDDVDLDLLEPTWGTGTGDKPVQNEKPAQDENPEKEIKGTLDSASDLLFDSQILQSSSQSPPKPAAPSFPKPRLNQRKLVPKK